MKAQVFLFIRLGILLACVLVLVACKSRRPEFAAVANGAGAAVDVETQRYLYEQTGRNPEQLTVMQMEEDGGSYDEKEVNADGVVYKDIYEKKAQNIVERDGPELEKKGFALFVTNMHFDKKMKPKHDLAVTKGYSADDLLALYQVSGPNYNITSDQVIAQIKKWEEHMTLRFVAFENDRFEAKITSMDYDVRRFAQENYDLCPDVIEQGYGDMEALIRGLSTEKLLWCWWD
jgi:hypothetical protein